MNKVTNLLFALGLLTFAVPVLAQEESNLASSVLRNTYADNWYISAGPSANILFAEQDQLKDPLKRIKFGGGISVGKWFNQNTGASLNIMGGGLRGFNLVSHIPPGYYNNMLHKEYPVGIVTNEDIEKFNDGTHDKFTFVEGNDGQRGFWQDYNYGAVTFDLMGNFTNLFRGRAIEGNLFDFVGFAGVGMNFAFNNKTTTPFYYFPVVRLGFRTNFNITRNIALYLEPVAYATEKEFDGYAGTAFGDFYTNLSLGVQYTFNKRLSNFEQMTIDELDRLNRRVNENRDLIDNHQDILERQQRLLDKLGNALAAQGEKVVPVINNITNVTLPEYVRFALDSYRIDKSEYTKIQGVVDFMKSNPEAKLLLVGYADRLTGNPPYNYNLSKKRVETVKNELLRLGISDSRLSIEWKGDREQPFSTNEWNRVVIMVERK